MPPAEIVAEMPSVAFDTTDCAIFAKYPEKVPFRDDTVPPPDKEKFKSIWSRLKDLATWVSDSADVEVPLTAATSHYAQNGRSQTDVWSCAFPKSVPNKSYGLQVAVIISATGAEICFCLGAGQSTLSGQAESDAKAEFARMQAALASAPASIVSTLEEDLNESWQFRQQWRRPAGTQDFSNLADWLAHASSAGGEGASISQNLTPDELTEIGPAIAERLRKLANAFGPLLSYVYEDTATSAIERALNEYEAEWDADALEARQASFEAHYARFDELFGTPEAVDALTAEDFFAFLNDLDAHVSPETGLYRLGPGLPAPKDSTLPTWKNLEEDLPKLREGIKQLLHEPNDSLAARIDQMLALPRPRIYITPQLALPSILLCFVEPDADSGIARMPQKEKKLKAMGVLPALDETASLGERLVAYEKVLSGLPGEHGKDWNWAERSSFYWSNAYFRNFEPPETGTADDSDGDADSPSDDFGSLAESLYVPTSFLKGIEDLLLEKKQVIFFGPPGTGKTWVGQRLIEHLAPDPEQREVVQFHPSYSYEDFVLGFRPFLTDKGELAYSLNRGPLLRLAQRALANPDKPFILLIDEINRGNLPRIFGELLFLLEYREQRIALMYAPAEGMQEPDDPIDAQGRFELPKNLWVVGTMNTADRSIGLIDAALRRRFHFVPFFPDEGALKGLLGRWLEDTQEPEMEQVADWVDALNALLRKRFGRHLQVGHSYFMRKTLLATDVARIWETDIMPFLEDQLMEQSQDLKNFSLDAIKARVAAGESAADAASTDPDAADLDGPPGDDEEPVYADDSAS